MMVVSLVLYFFLFLLALFLGVFLPGAVLVSFIKAKLSFLEKVALSFAVGIIITALLSFFLGLLRISFLFLPIVLAFGLWFVAKKQYLGFKKPGRIAGAPVLVIIAGALTQALLMFKSGLPFKGGLAFWGVHGYDGIWHSSLIAELVRGFPPQNPGFAGKVLQNYHFLTDLFLSQIYRFTQIPILDLYFRFSPLFFASLLNILVYLFALRWSGKKGVALLSVFFASIAGSFGWILPFLGMGSNNWETAFWGIQPATTLLNPPFGVSLIIILAGLILLDLYSKRKEKILAFLLIVTFGSLAGFKVYGALIFLLALGLFSFWEVLRRRDFSFFGIFLASGVVSLGVYLPFSRGSTDFLVWQPWWFITTMMRAPDRVNWTVWELRRQFYSAKGDFISLFFLQAIAFFIFLFGNLSARVVGFLSLPGRIKGRALDKVLLLSLPLAFLPPILFVQKAVPWNTIQFIYYFTFIFSFFAALAAYKILSLFKPRLLKITLVLILAGVSLPSTIETFWWFNAPVPTALLEEKEVEALSFLKKNSQKNDLLLTYPHGQLQIRHFPKPPVPLTYYNAPYVSFFTDRRVFLEDQNAATIMGYPLQERLDQEWEFFRTTDVEKAKEFLRKEKIAYIYLVAPIQIIAADKERVGLKEIFNNEKVQIFEVKW